MIFSYQYLLNKYNICPKGIIHIGAHHAEESTIYSRSGTDKVLWIEANPALIEIIRENISIYKDNEVYNILLSDSDEKEISFKITNASMSSSILSLGTHKEQFPDIIVEKELKLKSVRFDTFIKENNINTKEYNFINIDIQGAELLALKGFGNELDRMDYIYTEVNVDKVYEDCALLDELDDFLLNKGFLRVELSLKYNSWGDAFYIRKKVTENEKHGTISNSRLLMSNFQENKLNPQIHSKKKPPLYFRIFKKLYHLLDLKIKKNKYSLIYSSGEEQVAYKLLKHYKSKNKNLLIFDIGANIGEYSEMIIELSNRLKLKYKLHLFEPQPECYKILKIKFGSNPNIIINNVAVSNKNGFIDLFVEEAGSSSASPYKRKIFIKPKIKKVPTIKLDDYIDEHNIGIINLIKIDTEGHELEVLNSVKKNFLKIDNIQFEYGGTYQDANITLKDVFTLLRDSFYIGKIGMNEVKFTPFINDLEDFKYANYLAERNDLSGPVVDYSIFK